MFKKIALCLCFTLFLGLLSACSPVESLRLKGTESTAEKNTSQAAEPTENTSNTAVANTDDDTIGAPVALPPTYGDVPPKPGEINAEFMPNGLPVLQPKGINADQLFSEKIKDSGDRFDRVENAIVELRKEFDSVKPSIVRLAAVESDIQNLMKELEIMLQETPPEQNDSASSETEAMLQVEQLDPQPQLPPMTPGPEDQAKVTTPPGEQNTGVPPPPPVATTSPVQPQSVQPVPLQPAPQHVLKAPPGMMPVTPGTPTQSQSTNAATAAPTALNPVSPASQKAEAVLAEAPKPLPSAHTPAPAAEPAYDGIVAKNIRIGEHNDKVRIVLDTNQKTPFSIDLDNDEKLLIVELPNARWVGEKTQTLSDSKLLESYSIEPTNSGKGTMIVFTLKKSTAILKESTLPPDANPHHRIYFDLKP